MGTFIRNFVGELAGMLSLVAVLVGQPVLLFVAWKIFPKTICITGVVDFFVSCLLCLVVETVYVLLLILMQIAINKILSLLPESAFVDCMSTVSIWILTPCLFCVVGVSLYLVSNLYSGFTIAGSFLVYLVASWLFWIMNVNCKQGFGI